MRFHLHVATLLLSLVWIFQAGATNNSNEPAQVDNNQNTTTGYRSVAYFVNWSIYARNFHPQNLPTKNLTHILYAFANISPESGEVYLSDPYADVDKHYPTDTWDGDATNKINVYGCIKQLFLLKQRERKLKVLLSIGGWTYSKNFGSVAGSQDRRRVFADSAVGLVKDLGFDGVDVDWEYPKDDDEARNLVLLLKEVRLALDNYSKTHANGQKFLLTAATPAGPTNYAHLHLPEMNQYLDFTNIMTYDYSGIWDTTTSHTANLYPSPQNPSTTPYNTAQAITHYTTHGGIEPTKLVLGMPLYGRAFTNTDGLGSPFSGVGGGSWENGVWDYKALPLDGGVERVDEEVGGSYCYDSVGRVLVSYDSVGVARIKGGFVVEHGLGGGMWWEGSGDRVGEGSLISTVVDAFGGLDALDQSPNVLDYPVSKYENLRNGFPQG